MPSGYRKGREKNFNFEKGFEKNNLERSKVGERKEGQGRKTVECFKRKEKGKRMLVMRRGIFVLNVRLMLLNKREIKNGRVHRSQFNWKNECPEKYGKD